ncbi:MAG: acyl-CoA/acyl-ACP dehydrogenase [Candidatus Eremiobacteraeota bacterium]|nr:acyl-CoA/acyl-ACP dehydrogenase [Candidatus Eremiobacteraeota bacterium]
MKPHRQPAHEFARLLEQTNYADQPQVYYDGIRDTGIPYLSCGGGRASTVFEQTFECVYILARASLPLTVALAQHLYVISSLALAPFEDGHPLLKKRDRIVADFAKHKLLITVSTFGSDIDDGTRAGVHLEAVDKGFVANGSALFQSQARQADLLAFAAETPDGATAYFLSPLKGQDALKVGEAVFAWPMDHTDTRRLTFDGLRLGSPILADHQQTWDLLHYQTAWFQGLVSAAYLGAASRALEEARQILYDIPGPHGGPSAHLDSNVARMGRLVLEHRSAVNLVRRLGQRLGPVDMSLVLPLLDFSSAIKYHTTRVCNLIAEGIRNITGTRCLRPGTMLERVLFQLPYLGMHPLLPLAIERDFGLQALGSPEFVGL